MTAPNWSAEDGLLPAPTACVGCEATVGGVAAPDGGRVPTFKPCDTDRDGQMTAHECQRCGTIMVVSAPTREVFEQ